MFNLTENTFKVFDIVFHTIRIHINISKSKFSRSKKISKLKAYTKLSNMYENCLYHLIYNHYLFLKVQAYDLNTHDSV